jgi:hypothetical protein
MQFCNSQRRAAIAKSTKRHSDSFHSASSPWFVSFPSANLRFNLKIQVMTPGDPGHQIGVAFVITAWSTRGAPVPQQ